MWACGAYWQAGKAQPEQGHGYHSSIAYRRGLTTAIIRYYGTHVDREQLRKCLPLTEAERAGKLDPHVQLMEDEMAPAATANISI